MAREVIFIGAEHILSPLGNTSSENFIMALKGQTEIKLPNDNDSFIKKPASVISSFEQYPGYTKIESMCIFSALSCLSGVQSDMLSDKWVFVLSTTKGDIDYLSSGNIKKAKPTYLAKRIAERLPFKADTIVVSNACISGLSATIVAHDLIVAGKYSHAIVVGADVVSSFTTSGFESFYALSENPCSPYDEARTGLSLGEAASSVVLSFSNSIFKQLPVIFSGGATANDANHISGPSRTGDGLVRAINSAMKYTSVESSEIDFISAHGTGTRYNDDMESIALTRCGLNKAPMNSLKGYFGHTLGAAGVLELSMSIQSMRNGQMLKTLGCRTPGTTNQINVLLVNDKATLNTILKTASGFGGCNAAVILKNFHN